MNARRRVMVAGFAAAAVGDWFMAGPGRSFTFGVYAFSVAQLLWLMANVREAKFDPQVAVTVACPIAALFAWRVWPAVSAFRFGLVCGYGLLSVAALGVAASTRRFWYAAGVVRARSRLDRAIAGGLIVLAAGLGLSVLLHALEVIPFAPAVPTFQKLVIVSFSLWVACRSWRSDATSASEIPND